MKNKQWIIISVLMILLVVNVYAIQRINGIFEGNDKESGRKSAAQDINLQNLHKERTVDGKIIAYRFDVLADGSIYEVYGDGATELRYSPRITFAVTSSNLDYLQQKCNEYGGGVIYMSHPSYNAKCLATSNFRSLSEDKAYCESWGYTSPQSCGSSGGSTGGSTGGTGGGTTSCIFPYSSLSQCVSCGYLQTRCVSGNQQELGYANGVCAYTTVGTCGTQQTCSDTDGGKTYEIQGTLSIGGTNYLDNCFSSSGLTEYYCDSSKSQGYNSEFKECPNGCSNGVCLQSGGGGGSTINCVDSDGGQTINIKGILTINGQTKGTDSCDGSYIQEYYCDSSSVQGYNLYKRNCADFVSGICSNGACSTEDKFAKFEVSEPTIRSIVEKTAQEPAQTFEITIKNVGTAKSGTNLEALYISKNSPKYSVFKGVAGSYVFAFLNVEGVNERKSCQYDKGETFVQSVTIDPIEPGSSKTIKLNPNFPSSDAKFSDGTANYASDGAYLLFVGTFNKCGDGHTSAVAKNVQISIKNTTEDKRCCFFAGNEWDSKQLDSSLSVINNFIPIYNFLFTKFGFEPQKYLTTNVPEYIKISEGYGYIQKPKTCESVGAKEVTMSNCGDPSKEPKVEVGKATKIGNTEDKTGTSNAITLKEFDALKRKSDAEKNNVLDQAQCDLSSSCKKREGYIVECIDFEEIKSSTSSSIDREDFTNWFEQVSDKFGWSYEDGVCIASKEGFDKETSFCNYFNFLDDVVGDNNSCVVGVGGGILALIFLFGVLFK